MAVTQVKAFDDLSGGRDIAFGSQRAFEGNVLGRLGNGFGSQRNRQWNERIGLQTELFVNAVAEQSLPRRVDEFGVTVEFEDTVACVQLFAVGGLHLEESIALDREVAAAAADLDRALVVVGRDFSDLNTQTNLSRVGTTVVGRRTRTK